MRPMDWLRRRAPGIENRVAAGQRHVGTAVDDEVLGPPPQRKRCRLAAGVALERDAVVGIELEAVVDLNVTVKRVIPEEPELAVRLADAELGDVEVDRRVGLLQPHGPVVEGTQLGVTEARLEMQPEPPPLAVQEQVREEDADVVLSVDADRLVVPGKQAASEGHRLEPRGQSGCRGRRGRLHAGRLPSRVGTKVRLHRRRRHGRGSRRRLRRGRDRSGGSARPARARRRDSRRPEPLGPRPGRTIRRRSSPPQSRSRPLVCGRSFFPLSAQSQCDFIPPPTPK